MWFDVMLNIKCVEMVDYFFDIDEFVCLFFGYIFKIVGLIIGLVNILLIFYYLFVIIIILIWGVCYKLWYG